MGATFRVEDLPAGIRLLTLSHPKRRNALDGAAIEALFAALELPPSVRALLVRGEGEQAFCAGYDLTELPAADATGPLPDERLTGVLARLAAHPVPSVALVHGAAFGAGCDLACACDFRVGADTAVFCMPPARLGVVYAAQGISRLVARVGEPRAKRMFLTGIRVDARTALAWGLLDECHPARDAETAALGLAQSLAALAPLAVQGMKRTFAALAGLRLPEAEALSLEALRREAFASRDAREGRQAFLEKRSPLFRGE